jgi:hypothetical protein
MDQVRLQLQLLQQVDQPAPAVGGLERHRGAWRQLTQDRHSLGRIIGEVAVALLGAAASTMATWERLRCTSMPTYTCIRASFPELEDPEA